MWDKSNSLDDETKFKLRIASIVISIKRRRKFTQVSLFCVHHHRPAEFNWCSSMTKYKGSVTWFAGKKPPRPKMNLENVPKNACIKASPLEEAVVTYVGYVAHISLRLYRVQLRPERLVRLRCDRVITWVFVSFQMCRATIFVPFFFLSTLRSCFVSGF